MLTDDARNNYREYLKSCVAPTGGPDVGDPVSHGDAVILFILDLDERIERLRNPLTPESKGE